LSKEIVMATIDHNKGFDVPKFDHRILDLTGKRFERLTVLSFAGRNEKNLIVWNCLCDCGKTTLATSAKLRSKISRQSKRSCGCLASDITRERSVTHGGHNGLTYKSWRAMKDRCLRESSPAFDRYGERGITICDRWLNSFEAFREDMGERPSLDFSLDRIDNNGNYEPGNCRWATRTEQASNRRKKKPTLLIEFDGKTLSIEQWAELLGISVQTIYCRRSQGLPNEQVLVNNEGWRNKPRATITFNGETRTLQGWADCLGIKPGTIAKRRWLNWPIEKVLSRKSKTS